MSHMIFILKIPSSSLSDDRIIGTYRVTYNSEVISPSGTMTGQQYPYRIIKVETLEETFKSLPYVDYLVKNRVLSSLKPGSIYYNDPEFVISDYLMQSRYMYVLYNENLRFKFKGILVECLYSGIRRTYGELEGFVCQENNSHLDGDELKIINDISNRFLYDIRSGMFSDWIDLKHEYVSTENLSLWLSKRFTRSLNDYMLEKSNKIRKYNALGIKKL